MDIVKAAVKFWSRTAVATSKRGAPLECFSYGQILTQASSLADVIRSSPAVRDKPRAPDVGPRIAIMAPAGPEYVAATWASWLAGGVAVPLCLSHPDRELQYVMDDAQVGCVLASQGFHSRLAPLARTAAAELLVMDPTAADAHSSGPGTVPRAATRAPAAEGSSGSAAQHQGGPPAGTVSRLPSSVFEQVARGVSWAADKVAPGDGSLIIYTSGTTGRPKGAFHTNRSVQAQMAALIAAWEWRAADNILHTLPLHHTHGIVNALYCAHLTGACVTFQPEFSPAEAWKALQRDEEPITVYMGVPTMYSHLLSHYNKSMTPEAQRSAAQAAARLRLTVCGSAACPIPVMKQWEQLSGQHLLERYGMTETGMILSNPYHGERRPGAVGVPLPGVEVKVSATAEESGAPCQPRAQDQDQDQDQNQAGANEAEPSYLAGPGELCVKGDMLFKEYWRKPEATAASFDGQGFFKTGDTAALEGDPPYWRILGRTSVDIIKSGGFKVSALAIENVLLAHPQVRECAVVGIPDEVYGETIAAVVALQDQQDLVLDDLRGWAQDKLPGYQLPRQLKVVASIPRNAMGKINKKQLRKDLF